MPIAIFFDKVKKESRKSPDHLNSFLIFKLVLWILRQQFQKNIQDGSGF